MEMQKILRRKGEVWCGKKGTFPFTFTFSSFFASLKTTMECGLFTITFHFFLSLSIPEGLSHDKEKRTHAFAWW